jgi:iron complex outermembrane receptor protein
MHKQQLAALLGGTALIAVAPAAAAQTQPAPTIAAADTNAAAPQAAPGTDERHDQGGIADIVVTARRVSENLQTTPVAVSALSGDTLTKQAVVNIAQLANSTPSLTISAAQAQPGSATIFIRGQGSSDGLIAIDQAVGVYVNGVYSARSSGGALDLVDVSRVEVLRGPQGTLFGRNTTGGAINVIPSEPTGKMEGSFRADYGNYDTLLTRVVANVPIAGDELALRVAFQHREHSGYGYNATRNQPVGGENGNFVRVSLKAAPKAIPLTILVQGDYTDLKTSGQLSGLKSYTPTAVNGALVGLCGTILASICPYSRPGDTLANYVYGQNGNTDIYRTYNDAAEYGNVSAYGVSVTSTLDLSSAVAVKSIAGWRGVNMKALTDNDGTPYTLSGGLSSSDGNFINQDQFSEELQLSGKLLDNRLNYIVGAFYFVENGTDRSRSASVFPLSPLLGIVDGRIRNKSVAGYGQVTFELAKSLRLTAGTRFTRDTRSMVIHNRDQNLFTGGVTCSYTPTDGLASDPCRASFERSFSYWSYTFGLDYEVAKGAFLYAKTSRAYRSGGFNTRAVTGGVPPVGFEPERVTDYEIGGKFDFFDRHVRFNIAAYNSDVSNVQRNLIGTAAGNRLVSGVDNAATARIRGGEAELTVVPFEGLSLGAAVGLTFPKYKKFINSIDGTDYSDTPFIYTPKQTYTVSGDYDLPVADNARVKFHVDYSYRTKQYAVPLKDPTLTPAQNAVLQDTAKIPAYGLLNARIAFSLNDPSIEIAFFARNITKTKYFTRLLALEGTALGVTAYGAGDPRTYGVSTTFKF